MTDSPAPEALLDELGTLRRRTRADRHAYWFPLVLFGLAAVAAAPLYMRTEHGPEVTLEDGTLNTYPVTDHPLISRYWMVVLLGGALLTVWWYRRQGQRIGVEGRIGGALVAATLVVIGYAIVSVLPIGFYLWPLQRREFSALLVLAVGLLALARLERSRGLAVTAALFTVAAVLANAYNIENIAFRLGWDPFLAHPGQIRFIQLPSLALPALVLLVGGTVAGLRAWRARRRAG